MHDPITTSRNDVMLVEGVQPRLNNDRNVEDMNMIIGAESTYRLIDISLYFQNYNSSRIIDTVVKASVVPKENRINCASNMRQKNCLPLYPAKCVFSHVTVTTRSLLR